MPSKCGHREAECIIGDYWACPICDKEKAPDVTRELPGFAQYKLITCIGEFYCDSEDTFQHLTNNYKELDNLVDAVYNCYELGGTSFFVTDLTSVWQVRKFKEGKEGFFKLLIPKVHTRAQPSAAPMASGTSSQQQHNTVNPMGGGYYSGTITPLQQSLPVRPPYSLSVRTLPPPGIGHQRTSGTPKLSGLSYDYVLVDELLKE